MQNRKEREETPRKLIEVIIYIGSKSASLSFLLEIKHRTTEGFKSD